MCYDVDKRGILCAQNQPSAQRQGGVLGRPVGSKNQIKHKRDLDQAFRRKDGETVHKLIQESVTVTDQNCWEWPVIDANGYPLYSMKVAEPTHPGGKATYKQRLCHRMVYHVVSGENIDGEVIHHICANRSCVNPDHLQLVTQAENMAEMLARRVYETRISRLEDALRQIDPEHPLLKAA